MQTMFACGWLVSNFVGGRSEMLVTRPKVILTFLLPYHWQASKTVRVFLLQFINCLLSMSRAVQTRVQCMSFFSSFIRKEEEHSNEVKKLNVEKLERDERIMEQSKEVCYRLS